MIVLFVVFQVCPGQEYQRKLHPDDLPLRAQQQRLQKGETCHFLVRRNPNYPRRKQILPPITETSNSTTSIAVVSDVGMSCHQGSTTTLLGKFESNSDSFSDEKKRFFSEICNKCKNSFKSCDFCQKNAFQSHLPLESQRRQRKFIVNEIEPLSYNPVYNIREIRTVCHSFSSLGIDKKLLDIQINHKKPLSSSSSAAKSGLLAKQRQSLVKEQVNTNPAKGFGYFVYV